MIETQNKFLSGSITQIDLFKNNNKIQINHINNIQINDLSKLTIENTIKIFNYLISLYPKISVTVTQKNVKYVFEDENNISIIFFMRDNNIYVPINTTELMIDYQNMICIYTTDVKTNIPAFSKLRKLELIDYLFITEISNLPNLIELNCDNCCVTKISNLANLQRLNIFNNDPKVQLFLCNMPRLIFLSLTNIILDDFKNIQYLNGSDNLEVIFDGVNVVTFSAHFAKYLTCKNCSELVTIYDSLNNKTEMIEIINCPKFQNLFYYNKIDRICSKYDFKKFNKIVFTNKENKLCYKLTDDEQTVLLSFNNKSI